MLNTCTPLYDPAAGVTCKADQDVTGKRFVAIAGNGKVPNPLVRIGPANAQAFGVAGYDAKAGEHFPTHRVGIVPVTADVAFTANDEVVVGPSGRAAKRAGGDTTTPTAGRAVFDAAAGADVFVALKLA